MNKGPRYIPDQKIDELIGIFYTYGERGPDGESLAKLFSWGLPALLELKERRRLEDMEPKAHDYPFHLKQDGDEWVEATPEESMAKLSDIDEDGNPIYTLSF